MSEVFFKDWESLSHVAVATVIAFVTLFLFLRISGKRTMAKLNAFDFVVTIALGSTMAYMMLAKVPLAEGTLVLALIILMQYIFAWAARSSKKMEDLINAVPILIYYDGQFIEKAMQREAITKDEIYAALREKGINKISSVEAVVMELNGDLSVVTKSEGNGPGSLDHLMVDKL